MWANHLVNLAFVCLLMAFELLVNFGICAPIHGSIGYVANHLYCLV